jgi:hypothetical protein
MKDYADEQYLHARIYAMRGRLLSLKEYTSMAKEETFGVGTGDYIQTKENVFRDQIASIILLAEAMEEYSPLFISFLRMYEASNAKLLFAKAFGKQVLEQWYDIGKYAVLTKDLLDKQVSFDDINTILKGTYLEDALKDTSSYERIEIKIDMCTAKNLYDASISLQSDAKKIFQEFAARRLAVMGMIWQWRLKENYLWSDEKIKSYFEEIYDLFGKQALAQVRIVGEALNIRIDQIRKTGMTPSASDIEHHLEQSFFSWVSSMFHRDFYSIHCVVAYLWLLFYQIRNMFCIIEAKRFNVAFDDLSGRLICEA